MKRNVLLYAVCGVLTLPGVASAACSTSFGANSSFGTGCSAAAASQAAVARVTTQQTISVVSTAVQASLAAGMTSMFSASMSAPQPVGTGGTGAVDSKGGVMPSKKDGKETGISNGDDYLSWSSWLTADYAHIRINPDGNGDQRQISDIYSLVGGFDHKVTDRLAVGVSFAYSRSDSDNHNFDFTPNRQQGNSYTLTPYFGYMLADNVLLSGMVGGTLTDTEIQDSTGGTYGTGSTSGDTMFAATNVNWFTSIGSFGVKPFAGFSYQKSRADGYMMSNQRFRDGFAQSHWVANVGSQVSYPLMENLNVSASAAYRREQKLVAISESSADLSLGGDYKISDRMIFGITAKANVGRETQTEMGGMANLRYTF